MKTTFKKTMAVISAAAVVAASAAVMAVPTSAAGVTGCVGSTTLTESEAVAGTEVTLPVYAQGNTGFTSFAFGFSWDTAELTYVEADANSGLCSAALSSDANFVWYPIIATKTVSDEEVGYVTFTLVNDGVAGDVYTITGESAGLDGSPMTCDAVADGTITIVADETEAAETTTTEEETTEAEEETTTTTEAAVVATPATAVATTGSPKTGEALPFAGVAVAVAVIGGVALVSKRK